VNRKKAIGVSMVAIIILIISNIITGVFANVFVMIGVSKGICNVIAGVLYFAFALALLKFFIQKIMHLNLTDFGIPKFSVKIKWIVIALLLPLVVVGCYIFIFRGEFISSGLSDTKKFETLTAGIFFTGVAAGLVEEMVFRGIVLHALQKAWNTKVAIIVPSVLFGIVHILGMEFSIGSNLLVILAGTAVGIMFSLITIESGDVWCSGLVHVLWNIIIIGGGLSIGEKVDEYSIMTYVLKTKAFAVTGGEFGIEASIISLIGYLIVSVIAINMMNKK